MNLTTTGGMGAAGGTMTTGGTGSLGTGGVTGLGGLIGLPTGGTASGGSQAGGDMDTGGKDCTMERCSSNKLDVDDCGFQTVEGDVETIEMPGNVLVVYDRSGSMDDTWGGVPKYEAAGNALSSAMAPLQDLLTVGAVFFPSLEVVAGGCACNPADFVHWIPGPGACCLNGAQSSCEVNAITEPDQIDFTAGPSFIAELPNQWRLQGAGSTPLQRGLEMAQAAIDARTFDNSLTIIVVTDGRPNCGTDEATVVQQVTDWNAAGFPTYVIGLPGAQGAADLLNRLAVAGGTGQYIDPGDPAALEAELRNILLSTVKSGIDSCTINLMPPAEAPEKLRLVVTVGGVEQGVDRMLSDDASWDVTDDGAVVTLEGRLCDEAKAGAYDSLRFDFGCKELPPLPPPPPLE